MQPNNQVTCIFDNEDIADRYQHLLAFTEREGFTHFEKFETCLKIWHGDINYQIAEEPGTLLDMAVRKGCEKTVSLLIKYGAILDMPALNTLKTPLHHSVILENEKITEILLQNGASPIAPDFINCTPLHDICMKGDSKFVKLLLDYGANSSSKMNDFLTSDHPDYNGQNNSALEVAMSGGVYIHIHCMKTIMYHGHVEDKMVSKLQKPLHPRKNEEFLKYLDNVITIKHEIVDSNYPIIGPVLDLNQFKDMNI